MKRWVAMLIMGALWSATLAAEDWVLYGCKNHAEVLKVEPQGCRTKALCFYKDVGCSAIEPNHLKSKFGGKVENIKNGVAQLYHLVIPSTSAWCTLDSCHSIEKCVNQKDEVHGCTEDQVEYGVKTPINPATSEATQ